jgi:hypothetical protein
MTDVQEKYKDKIKKKLQEVSAVLLGPYRCLQTFMHLEELDLLTQPLNLSQQAAAAEAAKAARHREFTLGKLAYEKGRYPDAVQLLTQALDKEGPFSPLGGEVQLWLALAYQVSCVKIEKII